MSKTKKTSSKTKNQKSEKLSDMLRNYIKGNTLDLSGQKLFTQLGEDATLEKTQEITTFLKNHPNITHLDLSETDLNNTKEDSKIIEMINETHVTSINLFNTHFSLSESLAKAIRKKHQITELNYHLYQAENRLALISIENALQTSRILQKIRTGQKILDVSKIENQPDDIKYILNFISQNNINWLEIIKIEGLLKLDKKDNLNATDIEIIKEIEKIIKCNKNLNVFFLPDYIRQFEKIKLKSKSEKNKKWIENFKRSIAFIVKLNWDFTTRNDVITSNIFETKSNPLIQRVMQWRKLENKTNPTNHLQYNPNKRMRLDLYLNQETKKNHFESYEFCDLSHLNLNAFSYIVTYITEDGTGTRTHRCRIRGKKINMSYANLHRAKMFGVKMEEITLKESNLYRLYASASTWIYCDFSYCFFYFSQFVKATFRSCNFTGSKGVGANFEGATLSKSKFNNSNLAKSNFKNAKCKGVDFSHCDLTGSDFTGADLTEACFIGAKLDGVTGLHSNKTAHKAYFNHLKLDENYSTDQAFAIKIKEIHDNLDKASQLKPIFSHLKEKKKFTALTPHQLKTLNTEGSKNKVTKEFVKIYSGPIKLACKTIIYHSQIHTILSKIAIKHRNNHVENTSSEIITRILGYTEHTLPHTLFAHDEMNQKYRLNKKDEITSTGIVLVKSEGIIILKKILQSLSKSGIQIITFKMNYISKKIALKFYSEVSDKSYADSLIQYISSKPVIILLVRGDLVKLRHVKLSMRDEHKSTAFEMADKLWTDYKPTKSNLKGEAEGDFEQKLSFRHNYFKLFDIFHTTDATNSDREIKILFSKQELSWTPLLIKDRVAIVSKLLASKPKHAHHTRSSKMKSTNNDGKYLIMIKPDGLAHIHIIFQTIVNIGLKLLASKTLIMPSNTLKKLYAKYQDKYFFPGLIGYIKNCTTIVIAVQGKYSDLIKMRSKLNKLIKPELALEFDNQKNSIPKSMLEKIDMAEFEKEWLITFDYIHCSDVNDGAQELALFFDQSEIEYEPTLNQSQRLKLMLEREKARLNANEPLYLNPTF